MGQLFELIADHALEKLDEYYDECHVCNKTNIDLYQYQGSYQLESVEIDDEVYAVCADCILTKKLRHLCDFEYIETIEKYFISSNLTVEEQEQRKKSLIEKYQKTPDIPTFMQYEDRPLCCNNIAEFVGYPTNQEDLCEKTDNVIYWEKGIKERDKSYDFSECGDPESFTDVASFKCKHCNKRYFTFQFT